MTYLKRVLLIFTEGWHQTNIEILFVEYEIVGLSLFCILSQVRYKFHFLMWVGGINDLCLFSQQLVLKPA